MTEYVIHTSRAGFRHVYTLQPGEEWAVIGGDGPNAGLLVIVHPDKPVRFIQPDGTVTEVDYGGESEGQHDASRRW